MSNKLDPLSWQEPIVNQDGTPTEFFKRQWLTLRRLLGNVTTPSASDVSYDNAGSGLAADDVQEAIDELATEKLTHSQVMSRISLGF